MIEHIVRQHRGFMMSLVFDLNDSLKADRASYSYIVETPTGVQFIGNQYRPSPFALKDETKILDGLLEFICLKPGDTDKEYFDSYTADQIIWANSFECELAQSELPED